MKKITTDEALLLHTHLLNVSAQKAGWIDYRVEDPKGVISEITTRVGIDPERITQSLAERFPPWIP